VRVRAVRRAPPPPPPHPPTPKTPIPNPQSPLNKLSLINYNFLKSKINLLYLNIFLINKIKNKNKNND
jgi:hypothetical protein